MSVVIALKYKDGVLMGSDKQVSGDHLKVSKVTKIHKSKYSETAIGVCGSLRDLDLTFYNIEDLMDYKDILDNIKIDKSYVVNKIVPQLFQLLDKYKRLYKKDEMLYSESIYLVVSTDKIFVIESDGAVLEADKFSSIGCGRDLVKGYIDTIELNPEKLTYTQAKDIIVTAIKLSCKDDLYINDDIDFINLVDHNSKVKKEED